MERSCKKVPGSFCINDRIELENLLRILFLKMNGFCEINIHQDNFILD
jgi:hypothetical protein